MQIFTVTILQNTLASFRSRFSKLNQNYRGKFSSSIFFLATFLFYGTFILPANAYCPLWSWCIIRHFPCQQWGLTFLVDLQFLANCFEARIRGLSLPDEIKKYLTSSGLRFASLILGSECSIFVWRLAIIWSSANIKFQNADNKVFWCL